MESVADIVIRGPVRLPNDSELVTDADEEVFLLYSSLQTIVSSTGEEFRGLGFVDSRKDKLKVKFELKCPLRASPLAKSIGGPRTGPRVGRKKRETDQQQDKIIEIVLAQDKTALRSRKGDTGSVLWRASIDFAKCVLQQLIAQPNDCLFDASSLKTNYIVELGAGTGLLAVALSPFVGRYTATDQGELVPLIKKNLSLNFDSWPDVIHDAPGANVSVEDLDWVLLHSTNTTLRSRLASFDPIDVLLVVDCIYHPSLLPALVETIDYLATPHRTAVLIVVELRSDEVVREFLDLWIRKPGWEIWRVGGDMLRLPYVMWLGWRTESPLNHRE